MTPFTLPENTAAELLAMRLVLAEYLAAPDGTRPLYHQPFPLHQRAGLSDDLGAELLALWSNRRWWSPTPSYALGDPTEAGIVHFAKVVDALTPDAWRSWFAGLTGAQLLELVPRPWQAGPDDLVAMCFACGEAWATVGEGLVVLRCPRCSAPPKRRDPAPRSPFEDPAQAEAELQAPPSSGG